MSDKYISLYKIHTPNAEIKDWKTPKDWAILCSEYGNKIAIVITVLPLYLLPLFAPVGNIAVVLVIPVTGSVSQTSLQTVPEKVLKKYLFLVCKQH